ncbi:MAG: hypothetical protein QXV73_04010 [Candidatus Micrarchaeia archaeon]
MEFKHKNIDLDDLMGKYLYKSYSHALINYLSNIGTLELKFGKIAEKIFVVARLIKKTSMYNEEVIEIEGEAFYSIEDAMTDALYLLWEKMEKTQGE